MRLSLEVTRENDTWFARSPAVQGLLVTGNTLAEVLEELPVVAQALYEACQEQGWAFVKGAPGIRLADVVWVIEFPHLLLQAA